jgi:hypothetical protein
LHAGEVAASQAAEQSLDFLALADVPPVAVHLPDFFLESFNSSYFRPDDGLKGNHFFI